MLLEAMECGGSSWVQPPENCSLSRSHTAKFRLSSCISTRYAKTMAERFIAHVNLAAIRENIQLLKQHVAPARVMAVVKANAYGLGMEEVAKAALDGGADALGVVTVDEALRLRAAGFSEVPILCWLLLPDSDFAAAIKQKVTIAVSTTEQLQVVLRAGESLGIIPLVQLKVDTGLNRNGAHPDDWPVLMEA